MNQQTKIMETTPETDGQEKNHDETGEKRSKTKAKDDGTKKIEDVLASKEGKEVKEQDETEAKT